ncbi:MAG TPA: amidase [Blastocatellia bacterium]|jgi:Asp-tRNA(Asn)/Glu-tRNA(Gln) amidotransferase A subunit family amidase|nr:amidase [Blastocatellia bacterium]
MKMDRREMIKSAAVAGAGMALGNLSGLAAEYDAYDAVGLASLIAKKQITPLELLAAVRQRLEAINPKINAVCHIFFDKAEEQIKRGLPAGPLSGVPFALKDLGQYLRGTITSAGSRVWKDSVAEFDSTTVARYKQAGLVIFGKTTSPELGLTTTTESVLYGKTRNPWNLERTSGGSSGGSAAAVASRILPAAHASDGGGSIRIPASCCGLFGLKPTRGRVPMGPTQFEGWNGFSCHHAVTMSVRDSAALLDATAGAELGSPFFSPLPPRQFSKEIRVEPGKLRIALVTDTPGGTPLDPECKKAAVDAAKLCESLGHVVDEQKLKIDNAEMREAFLTVMNVSIARTLDDAARTLGRAVTEKDVETVTWATSQQGQMTDVISYSRAIATAHQVGLALAKFQVSYDVILSPTLAKPPVPLGLLGLSPENMQRWAKEITEFSPYTALYNITGQPSMSVPLHWTPDGLPVGVMFSARFGDEATLFRLAAQLEKAKPWAGRKPA